MSHKYITFINHINIVVLCNDEGVSLTQFRSFSPMYDLYWGCVPRCFHVYVIATFGFLAGFVSFFFVTELVAVVTDY